MAGDRFALRPVSVNVVVCTFPYFPPTIQF
nr:MAG TPA: hypothetical protein [Caudoviricetes sp.]